MVQHDLPVIGLHVMLAKPLRLTLLVQSLPCPEWVRVLSDDIDTVKAFLHLLSVVSYVLPSIGHMLLSPSDMLLHLLEKTEICNPSADWCALAHITKALSLI